MSIFLDKKARKNCKKIKLRIYQRKDERIGKYEKESNRGK